MKKVKVKKISKCRICNNEIFFEVIDLGKQPISNQFISKNNQDIIIYEGAPLILIKCTKCGLVQLHHTVKNDQIYREYWYRSGINKTMQKALLDIKNTAKNNIKLKKDDLIVDIGCNDGTLLNFFDNQKFNLIGFDPALNLSSKKEKFKRVKNYFSYKNFNNLKLNKKAKLITSIAMFYDLDNPNKFVTDIEKVLDDEGLWIVQFADLHEMLISNMYDQIIHEHLEYYHLKPLEYLFKKNNLKIVKIEKNNVNGSSYRLFIRKNSKKFSLDKSVKKFQTIEKNAKLENKKIYSKFRNQIQKSKKNLIILVNNINKKNKIVFGLGASTKGNVILNYCGFSRLDIPFLVDRNIRKRNCKAIGSEIPIITEDKSKKLKPDYFLLLPYFFKNEIIKRENIFLKNGGRIIIPLPSPKVIYYKKNKIIEEIL